MTPMQKLSGPVENMGVAGQGGVQILPGLVHD